MRAGIHAKREAVRDNLDAPFIGDGHIEVHVGEADVASDPRPAVRHARAVRDGVLKEREQHDGGCARGVVVAMRVVRGSWPHLSATHVTGGRSARCVSYASSSGSAARSCQPFF